MKKIIAVMLVLLVAAPLIFAKGDYGTPGEFLTWGAGTRSMGMGKAFAGLADDASAIVYNPAGLAYQNPLQVTLQHVVLFEDTMYDFAAVTYPVSGVGTFGLGYIRLGSTGFDGRDENWNATGKFDIASQGVMLSYARDIVSWFGAGLNLKLVTEQVFDKSAAGYGVDVGVIFIPADFVSVGISAMNVLPPGIRLSEAVETYPIILRFGTAFKLFGERIIPVFDVEKELSGKDLKFKMGLEAYPLQYLALRAGKNESELTFGLGVNFLKNYKVDYALAIQDIGLAHKASFTYSFGGFDVNLSAEPKTFSPVGTKRTTTVTIYAETKYPIEEWELNVLNEDGDPVRTFSGDDKPPLTITWEGKDDRGLPVSDGEYKFVMKVIDKNKKEIVSNEETVKISSALPMQPGRIELEE